jgi:hypothetical protein
VGENWADRRGALRGAVLAVLTVLLTAAGHIVGGGGPPDLAVLVVMLPPLALVLTAVADRSRSAVGTLAVLGSGQLVLHQLIEAGVSTHGTPTHADGAAAHGGHAMHVAVGFGVTPPSGLAMFLTHAAATLAIAAALRFADRAIAAVGTALRRVVPRRLTPLSADRPLATLATPGPAVSLRLARALAGDHVRRGPPVRC